MDLMETHWSASLSKMASSRFRERACLKRIMWRETYCLSVGLLCTGRKVCACTHTCTHGEKLHERYI